MGKALGAGHMIRHAPGALHHTKQISIVNQLKQPIMNDDKQQCNRTPWQSPELKTLSISRDTKQDGGPKDPPDYQPQAS